MKNIFNQTENNEQVSAVLVSVYEKGEANSKSESEASLSELERLLETAGGTVGGIIVQAKENPDKRTYLGSGKIKELKEFCQENENISLIVFDCELSPSQIRNIENVINEKDKEKIRVIDRSMLILDIFALHATTAEGKLQVELAQLKYSAPRLSGQGTQLSRLGGGIGTRGPGESKLETDRRHLERRVLSLEKEIENLERTRHIARSSREKSGIFTIAISGYTNAGKSTFLNHLTGAGILAEDKLFATLDPTTRKYILPSGNEILLTDTVGFIRNLPHHLISAFKSTLEEITHCDAVVVIVDASDNEMQEHLKVTQKLLKELKSESKPILYVYNKIDLITDENHMNLINPEQNNCVFVSIKENIGITNMLEMLENLAKEGKIDTLFNIPNTDGTAINLLYKNAIIKKVEYTENSVIISAAADKKITGQLAKYINNKND